MAQLPPTGRPLKRCFVSGPDGPATAKLIALLNAQGVETTSAHAVSAGSAITQEILRLIAASDFLAVVLGSSNRDFAMYELGVARSLAKPAFVVVTDGRFSIDISGIYIRAVDGPDQVAGVAGDLERFLRNAKAPPPIEAPLAAGPKVNLSWAREELAKLRSGQVHGRAQLFEYLVGRILAAAGVEAVATDAPAEDQRQVDFIAWLDGVVAHTGGPVLIDCKLFQGGSGSVIKNTEAWIKRLGDIVAESDSSLALLIYDHDRPHTPPSAYETPQVLSIAVEELIRRLEDGTLDREILRRRERAAFRRTAD